MGLRIFLRDSKPLDSIAKRLEQPAAARPAAKAWEAPVAKAGFDRADGEVTLIMLLDLETEAEIRLPGRFKVSPQIAGAIKAVPGVVDVQTV